MSRLSAPPVAQPSWRVSTPGDLVRQGVLLLIFHSWHRVRDAEGRRGEVPARRPQHQPQDPARVPQRGRILHTRRGQGLYTELSSTSSLNCNLGYNHWAMELWAHIVSNTSLNPGLWLVDFSPSPEFVTLMASAWPGGHKEICPFPG